MKRTRFGLLLLGTLVLGLAGADDARAAFAVGTATCIANNKTTTGTTGTALSCTVGTQNISAGQVAVLWFAGDNIATSDGNDGLLSSVTDSVGNSWTVQRCFTNGQGAVAGGATTCVATSKITTTIPTTTGTITANFSSITAKGIVVKNFTIGAGNTIEIAGTPQDTFNDSTSTAPGSLTISGLTASTEYLFVRATALERPNTPLTWTVTTNFTTSGCTGTTGGNALTNMETCGEFRILTATSATSNPTATSVDSASTFIAFREVAATTLGNGTDPANATRAPGGTAVEADAFTFQTSTGTDVITAVVVELATGTSAGLSLVEITNDAGTVVYGSVSDPASDTPSITLSTNTLTATTTATQYKIRITPKSHVNMPAPPGATYSVTAKISSWTGTNAKAGSDTAGTTITIDNLSPGNVTTASGTAGNGQVALSWTNPADGDFNSVVVLRDTITVADTPVEGTTYTVGNTIGTSVVRCVVTAPTASCTDTGVTNGDTYHYRIFSRDTNGNYATGTVPTGSPFTPSGPGCYSVATGNWNATSTWASAAGGTPGTCPGTGNLPDSATPVFINFTATSHTVTVNVSNAAATSVRIGAPGTGTAGLAMSSGTLTVGGSVTLVGGTGTKKALLSFTTGTLRVGNTITESGATDVTFGTGTVEYNGTAAQAVATYNYYNLTINKASGTATTSGNITIGNNLTLTTGTLNIANNTINGSGALTLASGSTLQIGAAYFPTYATITINSNSTVEYNPTFNITVPVPGGGANYGHLVLSSSGNRAFNSATTVNGNLTTTGTVAVAMNAGITVNGNFNLGSGTSFDAKAFSHTVKGNFTNNGTFTTNTGANTFTFNGSSAQAISGGATSFNTVVFNNAAGVTTSVDLTVTGNFTNTAGFNAGTTTTTFNGSAAQTIDATDATTTFYNLVFNNAAGFTLNKDITASNALTLTSGAVATGVTNTLIFSSTSTCVVTRGTGRVNGNLRKRVSASQLACDFEIGGPTNYSPVNVAFSSISGSGTLTAKARSVDHPQIDASGLDSTNSINRYWVLTPAGGWTFTGVTLTFTTIGGSPVDHDNTANVGSYNTRRFEVPAGKVCDPDAGGYDGSGAWSTTTATGTQTLTSIAATGISTFGSVCSHFAFGRSAITNFSRDPEFIFSRERYY